MSFVLRMIGLIWIFLSGKDAWLLLQRLLNDGLRAHVGLPDILTLFTLAGGVGLLMLKEWGRWVLLVSLAAAFLMHAGPSLIRLQVGPIFLRHAIFYGVFIVLLITPQARGSTRK